MILVVFVTSIVITVSGTCSSDGKTLGGFYLATGGPMWFNTLNWQPDGANHCSYFGVTCINQCVSKLDLNDNGLSGPLPTDLGSLSSLTVLKLNSNRLSLIPKEIGRMTSLVELSLFNNTLSGTLPSELGDLKALGILNLVRNTLSGTLPCELGMMIQLNALWLSNNTLSGTIPTNLAMLTTLNKLGLCNNQLSGVIPNEFGSLTTLSILHLCSNNLNGTLPSQLGRMVAMSDLQLQSNSFSGTIPSELADLRVLTKFHAEANSLCGTIPTLLIPLSMKIRLGMNCLDINSDTCNISWSSSLGPQASCSCAPCPTVSVNTTCSGSCVAAPVPPLTPQPTAPAPTPPAPLPMPAPTTEPRNDALLGSLGYSALSVPTLALGGAGLLTAQDMCTNIPGRNNRILMPLPTTTPNSYIYNQFIHAGLAIISGLVTWRLLPASGVCWSLFQTAFFGIAFNAGAIVSGGVGVSGAVGLAAGFIACVMYGGLLFRLVRKWRARIECIEVNDTVWVSWKWRGRGIVGEHDSSAHTSVLKEDDWWTYGDGDESNENDDTAEDSVGEEEDEEEEKETRIDIEDQDTALMEFREGNRKVADATGWYFVSPKWYFTSLRFSVCIGLPSLYILSSKTSCARISSVYCISVLVWMLFVVWKRPLCSIVSVALEVINSSSIVSGLLPYIFNLDIKTFSVLSTALSVGHFAGCLAWTLQKRRLRKANSGDRSRHQ